MSREFEVTGVCHGRWDRYIRTYAFEPLVRQHGSIRRHVKNHPGFPDRVIATVERTYQVWQAVLARMEHEAYPWINKHPDSDRDDEIDMLLKEMRNCIPAGVFVKGFGQKRTCRRYFVCPWCRYRKMKSVLDKLSPLLAEHYWLANSTIYQPIGYWENEHAFDCMKKLLRRIHQHNRTWERDVVLFRPKFELAHSQWYLATSLVVFGNDSSRLPHPERFFDPSMNLDGLGVFLGGEWTVERKLTAGSLASMVGESLEYSGNLLYKRFHWNDFSELATRSKYLRIRYHGFRSASSA